MAEQSRPISGHTVQTPRSSDAVSRSARRSAALGARHPFQAGDYLHTRCPAFGLGDAGAYAPASSVDSEHRSITSSADNSNRDPATTALVSGSNNRKSPKLSIDPTRHRDLHARRPILRAARRGRASSAAAEIPVWPIKRTPFHQPRTELSAVWSHATPCQTIPYHEPTVARSVGTEGPAYTADAVSLDQRTRAFKMDSRPWAISAHVTATRDDRRQNMPAR